MLQGWLFFPRRVGKPSTDFHQQPSWSLHGAPVLFYFYFLFFYILFFMVLAKEPPSGGPSTSLRAHREMKLSHALILCGAGRVLALFPSSQVGFPLHRPAPL